METATEQSLRIDALLGQSTPSISFEFFPPKNPESAAQLDEAMRELAHFRPTYVSVTYGAGGSTRRATVELAARIQADLGIRAMSHLTCMGHTRDELSGVLDQIWDAGLRNVLALRGDAPSGQMQFIPTPGGFSYANQLVDFVRQRHDFCVGVAGYPEGHPQSLNRIRDLENLKKKTDAGASFVVTQLFFDNADFYRFRDSAHQLGIRVPIIAGIMPIVNAAQAKRFVSMCGARIPHDLLVRIEAVEQDIESVHSIGVEHATEQCRDLLRNGVDGVHFYTLNRTKATARILNALEARHAG